MSIYLFYCKYHNLLKVILIGLVALLLFSSACSQSNGGSAPTPDTPTLSSTGSPQVQTDIPVTQTPSATPEPLAAMVNGVGITLANYQAELARYQAAHGGELTQEDEQRVLDDLINQTLLAIAAQENGFQVDAAFIDSRLEELINEIGSQAAFESWMSSNYYDLPSFRSDLARSIQAAWMRDQIIASVPETIEQVHVKQILLSSPEQAAEVAERLNNGADFTTLATEFDPVGRGELGWFPRSYLFEPALEQAAFELEPGQYSQVIETGVGFHILFMIERDPQRKLDPDPRLVLQSKALEDWLAQQRSQSTIEIMLP